jgi:tRNA threonylcarbamoyladenosine biosynthesis protein TsaB
MTILGLDTSTAASAACVLRGDGEAFEVAPSTARLLEPPAHSRELMPAIAEAMERAGVAWNDLEAVAVGVGPGTFTGLRIGVATARSLAHGAGIALRPVSSLSALAAGIDAPVRLALIDAKRGELFGALQTGDGAPVEERVVQPGEVTSRFGDGVTDALAAGDGSLRFRSVLEAAGIRVAADDSELHVVRALHVCRLAADAPDTAPEAVFPNYLRDPDAVPSQ